MPRAVCSTLRVLLREGARITHYTLHITVVVDGRDLARKPDVGGLRDGPGVSGRRLGQPQQEP